MAVLIPGLLRNIEENANSIDELASRFDLYIYTTDAYREQASQINGNVFVSFVEDDPYSKTMDRALCRLPEGGKVSQWHKLHAAFNALKIQEEKKGARYDLVYKLRSDLDYPEVINFDCSLHKTNSRKLFMRSDWYFGGCRDAMEIAADFFLEIFEQYYDRSNEYWPINYDALCASDPTAAKFSWLKYPRDIVGSPQTDAELFQSVCENADALSRYHFDKHDQMHHLGSTKVIFASESSFAHYLLSKGLVLDSRVGFEAGLLVHRKNSDALRRESLRCARDMIRRNELNQAESHLQTVLNLHPYDAKAYLFLCIIFIYRRKIKTAFEMGVKAVYLGVPRVIHVIRRTVKS